MVSLLDLEPAAESVTVLGKPVGVSGISIKGVLALFKRFPELVDIFMPDIEGKNRLDAQRLMGMGGEIAAAIIAAGTGHADNDKAEAIAGALSIDAQIDLISAIMRVTMPSGAGPFAEKLTSIAGAFNVTPTPVVPDKIQFPAGHRVERVKKSLKPSTPSSEPVTAAPMS